MNKAIKKAMEGGYHFTLDINDRNDLMFPLFDPLFWQALGKLEWNMTDPNKSEWFYFEDKFAKKMVVYDNTPIYHWHRFIDWIAEGKSTDSFFEELLK